MVLRLPPGFTVAQLDDTHWYPLEIQRLYSARHPEGEIFLSPCIDYSTQPEAKVLHFQRRDEAATYCQQKAQVDADRERCNWERIAVGSDLYPERCSHYIDLITEITGRAPSIYRFIYDDVPSSAISIFLYRWYCSCGMWHACDSVSGAFFLEEALEEVANNVYTSYQACQCSQLQEAAAYIAV